MLTLTKPNVLKNSDINIQTLTFTYLYNGIRLLSSINFFVTTTT